MALVMGPDFSDSDDDYLLDSDFRYKKPKNLLYLLRQPTEHNDGNDLLHFFEAVSRNNLDLIKEYIKKGFDVNSINSDGSTPLILSASHGHIELTELLLENGAKVNADKDGTTALMSACNSTVLPHEKSLEIIKNLIKHGADPKLIDRKRMTCLMVAATNGNLEAVKYLLPLSEKNSVDNQRWSALTWAVSNNQVEVAKYLIEEGFDLNISDVRGQTPLDIARYNDDKNMLSLFPEEKVDMVSDLVRQDVPFEDNFENLKYDEMPRFFCDLCEILLASKCESVIPQLYENNVNFKQFLSTSEKELKTMGVLMPYQRHRILAALHKFHKEPFHQESLHICFNNNEYTNIDVAIILLSAIKQVIAMESSLSFVLKSKLPKLNKAEMKQIISSLEKIEINIKKCQVVNTRLKKHIKQWDKEITPADLITKKSIRSKFPWKKLTFLFGVLGTILVYKLKKT